MHIFLTGYSQLGKTTVIKKILKQTGLRAGGFFTGFGPDRFTAESKYLYMYGVDETDVYDKDHAIAFMTSFSRTPFNEAFNRLGTRYIKAAQQKNTDIIIMDECSFLERDALAFQSAVLEALDGPIPVLGVVREGFPGWTKQIVEHPEVEVITVTEENRDELPDLISRILLKECSRRLSSEL